MMSPSMLQLSGGSENLLASRIARLLLQEDLLMVIAKTVMWDGDGSRHRKIRFLYHYLTPHS